LYSFLFRARESMLIVCALSTHLAMPKADT
jgi:hypothetical protein